jgi:hypothetical protein
VLEFHLARPGDNQSFHRFAPPGVLLLDPTGRSPRALTRDIINLSLNKRAKKNAFVAWCDEGEERVF